jgi:plasmid replication initiation protein
VGERNFERINEALKNLPNAKLSLINERLEFCRHLVPIIGTEYSRYTGKIVVSLHPELFSEYANMIHRGYTSYRFWQMLKLKKYFSKRLYEILSGRWLLNGGQWDIDVEVLKRLLSAAGYPTCAFVQRALCQTSREFEEKQVDIAFTYRLVKGAKNRVERVIFSIKKLDERGDERTTLSLAQNRALTEEFNSLPSADKNALALALMHRGYTFKHAQVDMIMRDPAKMALFYATHNKIEAGVLKCIQHKTRYMAAVLGFKDKQKVKP